MVFTASCARRHPCSRDERQLNIAFSSRSTATPYRIGIAPAPQSQTEHRNTLMLRIEGGGRGARVSAPDPTSAHFAETASPPDDDEGVADCQAACSVSNDAPDSRPWVRAVLD